MKQWPGILIAVLALSLLVWALVHVAMPGAPLTAAETAVVVGVIIAAVLVVRALMSWLAKRRRSDA